MNQIFGVLTLLIGATLIPTSATRAGQSHSHKDRQQPDSLEQVLQQQRDSLRHIWEEWSYRVPDRNCAILDCKFPRDKVGIRRSRTHLDAHPRLDSLLTPEVIEQLTAEIDARCEMLGKDSLCSSELFWVMRPYFDLLHHEDPHYRIVMATIGDASVYKSRRDQRRIRQSIRTPAFSLQQINDTLVIDRTLDTSFRRGDRVVAINGISAAEYLDYTYRDRYIASSCYLMSNYFYSYLVDRFRIDLERDGQPLTLETAGAPAQNTDFRLSLAEAMEHNIRTYADSGCGYIAIPKFFFNNNRLIRILHRTILDFKRQGIHDIILDLRRNPGGNGHNFDRLLSIFIDKPVVDYCTGQWVRASRESMKYYDFLTEEMLGRTVPIPEGDFVRSFPTDPKMFVAGMRYYVLIGRDTGSIAASFVNMLQYHGAAELAGEPLRHNALKYGEMLDGAFLQPSNLYQTGPSMVQIDECTRAVEGIIRPDIPIPAVAAEYLTGADGQLERLLAVIRTRNSR